MTPSALDDKSRKPADRDLVKVLGRAHKHWNELKSRMAAQYEPLIEEWNFPGQKHGWSLRLKHRKRAIVYLIPQKGHFVAALVLGEKAVTAARQSRLPASLLRTIDRAPKYPEGRGVRFEVRAKKDIAAVEKVAAIKMAN